MKYFRLTSGLLPRLFLLLLLAAGLAACNKEDKPVGPDSDELATVKLSLADVEMRAGDLYSGEDLIKKVRIYVFREGAGGLLVVDNQKLYTSGETDFTNPFTISAHAGPRHVYVVANEPDALKTQLDRVVFKRELDAIQLPVIDASVPQPFTMTGQTISPVTLNPNTTVTATVSLMRAVAKITLSLENAVPRSYGDITILSASIIRNTKNSTLLPQNKVADITAMWTWTKSFNELIHTGHSPSSFDVLPENQPLYVYENIGASNTSLLGVDTLDRAPKLMVEALFGGIKTRYYAYINDETALPATGEKHPYQIKRNHHYHLRGTITKIGEFSSLILTTQVEPWTLEEHQYDFLKPHLISIIPADAVSATQYIQPSNVVAEFKIKIKGGTGTADTKWDATLTNGLDFGFDGVHEGLADGTTETTIRVKALKPFFNKERKTALYFTVDGQRVILNLGEGTQITEINIAQGAI